MNHRRTLLAALVVGALLVLLPTASLLSQDTTPAAPPADVSALLEVIGTLSAENYSLKATLTALARTVEATPAAPVVLPDMEYRTVRAETFEMLLPEQFEGGDISENLEMVLQN